MIQINVAMAVFQVVPTDCQPLNTLQGTNISPKNGILKMIFLFPRWDMYPFPGGYIFNIPFYTERAVEPGSSSGSTPCLQGCRLGISARDSQWPRFERHKSRPFGMLNNHATPWPQGRQVVPLIIYDKPTPINRLHDFFFGAGEVPSISLFLLIHLKNICIAYIMKFPLKKTVGCMS